MAERTITDEEAMTRLHAALTGVEWDASMWDIVSDIIIATGRVIASPDEDDDGEPWCNHDAVAVHNGVCECGVTVAITERLEYLRGELRAERISMSDLVDLQSLAEHIDPGDVELLEAAGVPEFGDEEEVPS